MAITDTTLRTIARTADDSNLLIELYAPGTAPGASGFDPTNALKRYTNVGSVTFDGETYERKLVRAGRIRRTIDAELNSFSFTLDNRDRSISDYELGTGHEGMTVVVREISRSQSTALDESFIYFAGILDQPTSATRDEVDFTAKQIVGGVNIEIPRRKFSPDDPNGRGPGDILFEGFRFMPQYGTSTYSVRVRRGGLLGLLGFKKTIQKTLQWSTYSDLDADRYVPVVFGRAQIAGTHIAYADQGTTIQAVTAFCEGVIENFVNIRSDDNRFFPIASGLTKRFGELGGVNGQDPHPTTTWIGNGYYSRTALMFLNISGTSVEEVDPAPILFALLLGTKVAVPNTGPTDWTSTAWSDNGAEITRHLLTSPDYLGLDESWIDDESFFNERFYCNEYLIDATFASVIYAPDTTQFQDEKAQSFALPTGQAEVNWFKYNQSTPAKTLLQVMAQTPWIDPYSTDVPLLPPDPGDFPGGGTTTVPTIAHFFVNRRYTTNVAITDRMSLTDFFYEVLFPSFRGYMVQGTDGRVQLRIKKPAIQAFATGALSGGSIDVDDVSDFIVTGYADRLVCVDPNTTNSEVREVKGVTYDTAQNSVALTGDADLTIVGFSGCDGASTPATATVTVDSLTGGTVSLTLDGIVMTRTYVPIQDSVNSVAGFLAAGINAHPKLRRKFLADWDGSDEITITAKFGTLSIDSLTESHVTGLADPTVAPTVVAGSGGSLVAGNYEVSYSYENDRGETLVSPSTNVAVTAGQKLAVSAVPGGLPSGANNIRWFCTIDGNVFADRYHSSNDGSAFDITDAPLGSASVPSLYNYTFAEVLEIQASFIDQSEPRQTETSSNVIRASFQWSIPRRENSINQVVLKYRDSVQDFRLTELRISDPAHIAKVGKVNPLEVNGTGIDNYHQAIRIGSGILSEELDHGFFYRWRADKGAKILQEGDVVCISDTGSGVVNLPVRIEEIEITDAVDFAIFEFRARKYSSGLYDDSVSERNVPVIVEGSGGFSVNYA